MADEKRFFSLEGEEKKKVTLHMSINAERAAAIHKCLEKGELRIEVSNVNLGASSVGEPWLYD